MTHYIREVFPINVMKKMSLNRMQQYTVNANKPYIGGLKTEQREAFTAYSDIFSSSKNVSNCISTLTAEPLWNTRSHQLRRKRNGGKHPFSY